MAIRSKIRPKIIRGGKPAPEFDKQWLANMLQRLEPIIESYVQQAEEEVAKRAERKRLKEEGDRIDAARPEGAPRLLRDFYGVPVQDAGEAPTAVGEFLRFGDGETFGRMHERKRLAQEIFVRGNASPDAAYERADAFLAFEPAPLKAPAGA